MARYYSGGSADQKDFVNLFDKLTGKHNRWEVWKDMVWMFAIAISNSVDKRYAEGREKTYMSIVKKYTKQEVDLFVELYGLLYKSIIARTESSCSSWGDFLGEMFMNLNLGNELGGQFFTPYHVCHMMSRATIEHDLPTLQKEISEKGYFSCYDGAVGAGAMLIAAAEVCVEQKINYPFQVMFVAQEIDSTTALMCYIQLSLLGCAGYVVIGNTLSDPSTGHVLFGEDSERCWYTPMFFEETWHRRREVEVVKHRIRKIMGAINTIAKADEESTSITEIQEEQVVLMLDAPGTEQEPSTPPEALEPALVAAAPISPPPAPAKPRERPRRPGKAVEGQMSLFDL